MRLGLDLRAVADRDRRQRLAVEADRLGLWAVLIDGGPGPAAIEAATLATVTDHVHLALWLDPDIAHPLALAEEVAIVDHLSQRRAMAVVGGSTGARPGTQAASQTMVDDYLRGVIVDGAVLTPPPAQTRVPVWSAAEAEPIDLTGDLDRDRVIVDASRDGGRTHLFVTWPDSIDLRILARHLVTRAAGPGFPQVVADLADVVEPIGDS